MFKSLNKANITLDAPIEEVGNALNSKHLIELVNEMTQEWIRTLDSYAKETAQLEVLSKRGRSGTADQITYLVGMKKSLIQQIDIARTSLISNSKNLVAELSTQQVAGDSAIVKLQQNVSDFSEIKAEIELLKFEYLDGVTKHCPSVIY